MPETTCTPTLASRLAPLQDALAELAAELYRAAQADNEPADWQTWADLSAALMAVRSAQGREARLAGYRPEGTVSATARGAA